MVTACMLSFNGGIVIEDNLKRKMRTPNDFIFLVGAVWERTRQTISPTTLKRLWGYIDGADETRNNSPVDFVVGNRDGLCELEKK